MTDNGNTAAAPAPDRGAAQKTTVLMEVYGEQFLSKSKTLDQIKTEENLTQVPALKFLISSCQVPDIIWTTLVFIDIGKSQYDDFRKSYEHLIQAPARRDLQWVHLDRFNTKKALFNIVGMLLYVSGEPPATVCDSSAKKKGSSKKRGPIQDDDDDNDDNENPDEEDQQSVDQGSTDDKKKKTRKNTAGNTRKCEKIWKGCFVGSTHEVKKETSGACANCWYNSNQTRCSFLDEFEEAKKKESEANKKDKDVKKDEEDDDDEEPTSGRTRRKTTRKAANAAAQKLGRASQDAKTGEKKTSTKVTRSQAKQQAAAAAAPKTEEQEHGFEEDAEFEYE